MTHRSTLLMLVAAAAAALAAPAAPVAADEQVEMPKIVPEDVTLGQIVSFVNAVIRVEHIQRAYMPRIAAAKTDDERKQLIAEADQKAMTAVDAVPGITPGEYLAIAAATKTSPELTARIDARINELKRKQSGGRFGAQSGSPAPMPAPGAAPAAPAAPAE